MEQQTETALNAVREGFAGLSALAVQYAFSVLGAILLLIAGYFIAGVIERALGGALGRVPGFDATLSQFFARIGRYIVLALVVVMVLGQFGVQTASIIAAIGAVGLAVGLALQGTLQNIAAGIMLLALRPFRIGESVEVGDVKGTVEDIGLFATRVRTDDGLFVLAPNSLLWDKPVQNFTRNGTRRADIRMAIRNDADLQLALDTLDGLARQDARVLQGPAPSASVEEVKDGAANLVLSYWTTGADHGAAKAHLTKEAKLALDRAGIALAEGQS